MWTRRSFLTLGVGFCAHAFGAVPSDARKVPSDDQFLSSEGEESLIAPEYRKQLVPYSESDHAGALVIDPERYFLYQVRSDGRAIRYGVGVGREGFSWRGKAQVMRKERWPNWYPPAAMRERQPYLPRMMPGGKKNPLGARALYLYEGKVDTLYRIHGTIEPETIGTQVSSGCVRMLNEHVIDLYRRIPLGTRVVVL